MRQALDNIVSKLKTDPFMAIAVHNTETFAKIIPATTGNILKEKHGSIENFFDSLFKNGNKSIAIQEYRANGTGIKKIGSVVNFNFSENNEKQMNNTAQPNSNPWGLAGQVGLGFTDIINLTADSRDKVRLETENVYLKTANEDLKKLLDELKEEKLATKYDSDGKKSQTELLLGLANAFGPQLAGLLTKTPTGLSAPEPQAFQDDAPNKQVMFQMLNDPNFSDAMAQLLLDVTDRINKKPDFHEKLMEILNPVF